MGGARELWAGNGHRQRCCSQGSRRREKKAGCGGIGSAYFLASRGRTAAEAGRLAGRLGGQRATGLYTALHCAAAGSGSSAGLGGRRRLRPWASSGSSPLGPRRGSEQPAAAAVSKQHRAAAACIHGSATAASCAHGCSTVEAHHRHGCFPPIRRALGGMRSRAARSRLVTFAGAPLSRGPSLPKPPPFQRARRALPRLQLYPSLALLLLSRSSSRTALHPSPSHPSARLPRARLPIRGVCGAWFLRHHRHSSRTRSG